MSKTRILIHFVFVTKNRYQTLPLLKRQPLYAYINGIISHLGCMLLEINGMSDHIHMLVNLNPTVSPTEIMKKVKQSSSYWLKRDGGNLKFDGWAHGYFAASVSPQHVDRCQGYIKNQELHHGGKGLVTELEYLLENSGLEWYDEDWK